MDLLHRAHETHRQFHDPNKVMPHAYVRLSAGRRSLSDEGQALCFYAGANSIFYGDKLLTTGNPDHEKGRQLFAKLGLVADAGAC